MILGFGLVSPLMLVLLWQWSPLAGLGVVLFSHALILYPTLRPNSQWLGPVVTRFSPAGKEVWLTIDDGPAPDTSELLDLFDERSVKATFFVKGTLARRYPEIIREIAVRGHSVANHSSTHPSASFWCLPPSRLAREIDDCNHVLAELSGTTPRWFRAPVGMKNPAVHPMLERRGMRLVGWSARAFDAVTGNTDRIVDQILSKADAGSIILLHQGHAHSVEVMERVITALQERGYSFVIPADDQLRSA